MTAEQLRQFLEALDQEIEKERRDWQAAIDDAEIGRASCRERV